MTQVKTYVSDECVATAEQVKVYSFRVGKHGQLLDHIDDRLDIDKMIDDELSGGGGGDETPPSEQLHQLAQEYNQRFPTLTYRESLGMVMEARPELVHAYGHEHGTRPRIYAQEAHPGNDPAVQVHEKAVAMMDRNPDLGYSEAAARVLKSNPRLQQRWSQFASCGA